MPPPPPPPLARLLLAARLLLLVARLLCRPHRLRCRLLVLQIEVIRSIDDHGEVMLQTARMALRIMRGFQVCLAGLLLHALP